MTLSLGWHTDLAVLRLGGSTIEEHPDHLVVRTPAVPTYHWGNFLLVTDASSVEDADRWLARFEEELPEARHRAVGLVQAPADASGWVARGLVVEFSDVLESDRAVDPTPLADGYAVRPLTSDEDWSRSTRLRIEAYGEARFDTDMTQTRREMVAAGHARWFGAFRGESLAAEVGMVDCGAEPAGRLGRFQSVLTAQDHRRRGLTSHLLGAAAGWALHERGCDRLVIIADDGTDANRLYRARGFRPAERSVQVHRNPVSPSDGDG